MRLFATVIGNRSKLLCLSVSHFRPSLLFERKEGAYPSGASYKSRLRVAQVALAH
jgi:hypothetical protein